MSFVATLGGAELVKLTVSGHPGSGTSTLVDLICQRRGWTSLNGGEVFREEAKRRGIDLESFSKMTVEEPQIDKDLDAKLVDAMNDPKGPQVVESRLSGWWAMHEGIGCVRLWLEVSVEERARRVVKREGGSVDEAMLRIIERMNSDQARYSNLYEINLEMMTPYNLIIEADDRLPDELADLVEQALEDEWR